MALEIWRHCTGGAVSSKQLNRSSKASLSPLYLAHERLMQKKVCADTAGKEGSRLLPKVCRKTVLTSSSKPRGLSVCWELCTPVVQYPEGLLRESANNSFTTCQVSCPVGILCLFRQSLPEEQLRNKWPLWDEALMFYTRKGLLGISLIRVSLHSSVND